jgi:putative Mn2+ efflux pump MntP
VELFDILVIAVGLAIDAFTVALAVGLHLSGSGGVSPRQYFRLGFHFGLFQFTMPILGWVAGHTVRGYIDAYDHWIASILLAYIGIRMIREGTHVEKYRRDDPTRGVSLVLLSIATSIDALAMGLSIAILGVNIVFPAAIIGVVALVFTCAGMALGGRIGRPWRRRAAWFGGILLVGIGVKILLEHLR